MTLIYGIIECILYQTLVIWKEWLGTSIFLPFVNFLISILFFSLFILQQYTFFSPSHYVIVIKYFANVYCL